MIHIRWKIFGNKVTGNYEMGFLSIFLIGINLIAYLFYIFYIPLININQWALLTKSNKSKNKSPELKRIKLHNITSDNSKPNSPNTVPNSLNPHPKAAREKASKSAASEMPESA